jgi:Rrf2 family protein
VDLALHWGEGPVQSAEIARRQCIPEPYLDQLLTTLRRAGFIRSVRGPQGGHQLVREPGTLPMLEAVEALEGPLSPAHCTDEGGCSKHGVCPQRDVWEDVRRSVRDILGGVTIADLAEREREGSAAPRYYI